MQSLIPKESYIECRLCGNTISSSHPTCRKCGLSSSTEGVEELAQIEDQISQAVNDANTLRLIASISLFFSIISVYYYFVIDPQAVWFNLPLWVSYLYFIISFIRWNRKYSKIVFNIKDFENIRKEKRNSLILIAHSMILGFGLTILLR